MLALHIKIFRFGPFTVNQQNIKNIMNDFITIQSNYTFYKLNITVLIFFIVSILNILCASFSENCNV